MIGGLLILGVWIALCLFVMYMDRDRGAPR